MAEKITSVYFYRLCALLIVIICLQPYSAVAQMFSVGEGNDSNRNIPQTALYLGAEPVSFDYQGGMEGVTNPGSYEFDGTVVRLSFETPFINLSIGSGGRLTGIDDVSYFDAGLQARQRLRIARAPEQAVRVFIPLQLKSTVTSVVNDEELFQSQSQFQQGTLTFGGGISIEAQLSERSRFAVAAIPNYGFSFATGGTFGGSIFDMDTEARFYLDRLFGDIGISAGYNYIYKNYDIDRDRFDYTLSGHRFQIGITF